MERCWKLVRVGLWLAIAAFVVAGVAGMLEDHFGWSDDPRWDAYLSGVVLTFSALVGSTIAKVVDSARKQPSRFPTRLLLLALGVGILVPLLLVLLHLDDIGPMGVV